MRSKRRDKLVPRLRVFLLQNFTPVWRTVERVPPLARLVNRLIINTACNTAAFRPHAMSTLGDYTSWSSLTDRTYLGRMIPPLPAAARDGPSLAETTALFAPQGPQQQCPKSTLLFPIFAQYLTDGFLRTSSTDRARTTSNHDIDLSPLYGRTPAQTLALRAAPDQGRGKGRLKSQWIGDEEFPPDLYRTGTSDIAADFADAHGTALLDLPLGMNADPPWAAGEHSRRRLFAVGGDRVNSTALVAMLNTLFLREHNRLAAELERRNPGWGDTRIFETARNIVIVLFIKIVIEEYINHISSACFRLRADPRVAWNAPWNKPNWMTVEFSLLYRWHSLVPETMLWDGERMDTAAILLDNRKLIEAGLAKAFKWAGQTPAARLGLHNTAIYLENRLTVESRAIEQNRARRLPGYNAYRRAMGMNPVDDFDCMTGDRARQEEPPGALRDARGGRLLCRTLRRGCRSEHADAAAPRRHGGARCLLPGAQQSAPVQAGLLQGDIHRLRARGHRGDGDPLGRSRAQPRPHRAIRHQGRGCPHDTARLAPQVLGVLDKAGSRTGPACALIPKFTTPHSSTDLAVMRWRTQCSD